VFKESSTVEPVSWFRRVTAREPEPTPQAVPVEVTVNEAGLTVLGVVNAFPMNGG